MQVCLVAIGTWPNCYSAAVVVTQAWTNCRGSVRLADTDWLSEWYDSFVPFEDIGFRCRFAL